MNIFTKGLFVLPMTPAQSWTLVIVLGLLCWIATYGLRTFIEFINLCVWNVKIKGAKGVLYALRGYELEEILKEKVISVARSSGGAYKVFSSNGEECFEYFAVPISADEKNEYYKSAIELSSGNKELFRKLKPDSRVIDKFTLMKNELNKAETAFVCVVYLKSDNSRDVEEAFNKFFEFEYRRKIQKARRNHCLA